MGEVYYSAVILNSDSRELLLNKIAKHIQESPFDYDDIIAHHMTINMGELPTVKKYLINQELELEVSYFGYNEMCFAVQINDDSDLSENNYPHITIGVNRKKGGRSKMSNDITNWVKISPFKIKGIVQEVQKE